MLYTWIYDTLRLIVGHASVTLTTEAGDTVADLLEELVARWPDLKRTLLTDSSELRSTIHLFVNGRDVRYLGGLGMVIPPDADICLFSPVGGGA